MIIGVVGNLHIHFFLIFGEYIMATSKQNKKDIIVNDAQIDNNITEDNNIIVEQIDNNIGAVRFVYNYFLDLRIEKYKTNKETFNYYQCSELLTQMKKQEEFSFLKDVESTSLQQSLKNLEAAFKNFFRNNTFGFPNFKSKRTAP